MLTYGDGLTNLNFKKLLKFHKKQKNLITLTAVHPTDLENYQLQIIQFDFEEKPQLQKGWINGGFFVVEPDFVKLVGNKNVILKGLP